jgi:hypothetical protein
MSNFYLSVFGLVALMAAIIKGAYLLSTKMMVEEIAAIFAFSGAVVALAFFY